jgi:threonine/homoserine/homoserine lactone efflux protein
VFPAFPLFLKGCLLGFSIAAPVGPIGVLCIRRTLAEGKLAGFLSGMGAAFADMIYGSIAAFGLAALTNWLIQWQNALQFLGGGFILYLGVRAFFSPVRDNAPSSTAKGLLGNTISTFLLTLTNPMTILSFIALFSGLGAVGQSSGFYGAAFLVLGVFVGSALWWLILSQGIGLFRRKMSSSLLGWVNHISGIVIFAFGVFLLLDLLTSL